MTINNLGAPTRSARQAPALPGLAGKSPTQETGTELSDRVALGNTVKKAVRFGLGAAGAAAGAVAGAIAGVAVGGVLGAVIGTRGEAPMSLDWLRPLHNVVGLPGQFVHGKVEGWVERAGGARFAGAAGAIAGGLTGAVAGGVIGVLGLGLAGADVLARQAVKLSDRLIGKPEPGPDTDSRPTYERGWGKQIPTPDGVIREDQHHFLYNNAAMEVLAVDAQTDPEMARIQQFFNSNPEHLRMLQMGGWNEDSYLGRPAPGVSPATFHHFTEPFMPGFKAADWQARQCYDRAADAWKEGDRPLAMYYLGASVHLAQDVALPQHATGEVSFVGKMIGHQMMEKWAESQFDRLKPGPGEGGLYPDAETPEEFVAQISEAATAEYGQAVKDTFRYVAHREGKARQGLPTDHESQTDFDSTPYAKTMKRAVQLTPGFFRMFFRDMEGRGYPI